MLCEIFDATIHKYIQSNILDRLEGMQTRKPNRFFPT